jgi:hypothetical protein
MAELDEFLNDERLVARRPPPRRKGPGRWIAALLVLAAAVATGLWLAWQEQAGAPAPTPIEPLPAAAQAPGPAPQRHPIAAVDPAVPPPGAEPLPPLADSDASVLAALAQLLGLEDPAQLFVPSHLVPRIVAAVDALPERRLARRILPLQPLPSRFQVQEQDGSTVVAADNSQRYERHVALFEAVDSDAAVAAYVHYYPLFQQAYRELGYPDAHFNDRLVAVIDHLLAAPAPGPGQPLVPYKDGWAYADPALENASAGHRLLFRLSPDQRERVNAKLRELRAAIASEEAGVAP